MHSPIADREIQDVGFTQPSLRLLARVCSHFMYKLENISIFFLLDDNPVVSVGTTLEYHCPEGHFFEHDYYAPTKARILCQPDGTFWEPLINGSWPTCIIRELGNI